MTVQQWKDLSEEQKQAWNKTLKGKFADWEKQFNV